MRNYSVRLRLVIPQSLWVRFTRVCNKLHTTRAKMLTESVKAAVRVYEPEVNNDTEEQSPPAGDKA